MDNSKTYSVYVHRVQTEEGPKYYTGVTTNIQIRWFGSGYRGTSLYDYIGKYGWNHIDHAVVFETTDRKKAYEAEDLLIRAYSGIGRCINEQRSGLVTMDYNAHLREKRANDQEWAEHIRQYKRDKRANDPEFAERDRKCRRECQRRAIQTPEGKIYNRVNGFNFRHPDRAIETPMEAKMKYLECGYIPTYVKHDDI